MASAPMSKEDAAAQAEWELGRPVKTRGLVQQELADVQITLYLYSADYEMKKEGLPNRTVYRWKVFLDGEAHSGGVIADALQ